MYKVFQLGSCESIEGRIVSKSINNRSKVSDVPFSLENHSSFITYEHYLPDGQCISVGTQLLIR